MVKLIIEHHLEFLSLKGGFTGSSESTPVKRPHCWKSQVTPQILLYLDRDLRIIPLRQSFLELSHAIVRAIPCMIP